MGLPGPKDGGSPVDRVLVTALLTRRFPFGAIFLGG